MTTVPDGFHARSAWTSTMVSTGLGTGMPRPQYVPIVSMRRMLCARRPWRVVGTDGKPRAPSVLRAASWLAETGGFTVCPSVGKCECGRRLHTK